jgi:hypothetical protein
MEINQLQKCTACKVSRDLGCFIGKNGKPVKTCNKCREKDDKQKQRPDVIEKKNQRNNERQYYKDYREKKRNENEEEYLRHNAEVARAWRAKAVSSNPETQIATDGAAQLREYAKGSNLPADSGVNSDDIPKYCYYVKPSERKGDGFCCGRFHPKQKEIGKEWKTTRSKAVSLQEKLQQLLDYINGPSESSEFQD